jgi:polyhydroxybutyrate depolymerase
MSRRRDGSRRLAALAAVLLLASTGIVRGASPSRSAPAPGVAVGSPVDSPAETSGPTAPLAASCRTLLKGPQLIAIPEDGVDRQVLVVVPPSVAGTGPMPLVLAFHAHGAHAGEFASTSALSNAAIADGFVVAFPQGDGEPPDWHIPGAPGEPVGSEGDIPFVERLLDRLGSEGCVDVDHIVLVGHSKGGGMAEAVACRMADRVTDLVLAAATQFGLPCEPSRPIPVVAFHAVDDRILPYGGGPVRGAPPAYPGVVGVEDAMARWAALAGCTSGPTRARTPGVEVLLSWQGCRAPVALHRLARGGHRYPAAATQVVRSMVRAMVAVPAPSPS